MHPAITVVIVSYNRGSLARRAVESVLAQHGVDLEVVVVDASDDGTTRELLESISDDRVEVVTAWNAGMNTNRNVGIAHARGRWLAFLDDDDTVSASWASVLLGATGPNVGLVVGSHIEVDTVTEVRTLRTPVLDALAPTFFVGGTFLAAREAIIETGGMLDGLPMAHHWDLAVRLTAWCREHERDVVLIDEPVAVIERRPVGDRIQYSSRMTYEGKRWVRARHARSLADRPEVRATQANNIGVPAFRTGRVAESRRWFALGVLAEPARIRSWVRLAAASVTPLGRVLWGVPRREPLPSVGPRQGIRALDEIVRRNGPNPNTLVLPYRYVEATLAAAAGVPADEPERTAIAAGARKAAQLARSAGGSVERIEVDERGELIDPDGRGPAAVVLVAAVLGRAVAPFAVLDAAHQLVRPGGTVVVSEPDRDMVDGRFDLGPPSSGRALRRWTPEELDLLLTAADLEPTWIRPKVPVVVARRRGTSILATSVRRAEPDGSP